MSSSRDQLQRRRRRHSPCGRRPGSCREASCRSMNMPLLRQRPDAAGDADHILRLLRLGRQLGIARLQPGGVRRLLVMIGVGVDPLRPQRPQFLQPRRLQRVVGIVVRGADALDAVGHDRNSRGRETQGGQTADRVLYPPHPGGCKPVPRMAPFFSRQRPFSISECFTTVYEKLSHTSVIEAGIATDRRQWAVRTSEMRDSVSRMAMAATVAAGLAACTDTTPWAYPTEAGTTAERPTVISDRARARRRGVAGLHRAAGDLDRARPRLAAAADRDLCAAARRSGPGGHGPAAARRWWRRAWSSRLPRAWFSRRRPP